VDCGLRYGAAVAVNGLGIGGLEHFKTEFHGDNVGAFGNQGQVTIGREGDFGHIPITIAARGVVGHNAQGALQLGSAARLDGLKRPRHGRVAKLHHGAGSDGAAFDDLHAPGFRVNVVVGPATWVVVPSSLLTVTAVTLRTPSGLALVAPSWYWRPGSTVRSSAVTGVAAWVFFSIVPDSHSAALAGEKLSQLTVPVRSTWRCGRLYLIR